MKNFFLLGLLCSAFLSGGCTMVGYETQSGYIGPYGGSYTRTITWVPASSPQGQMILSQAPRKATSVRHSHPIALLRPVPGWITNGPHGKYHAAIDFHAPIGTPVRAAASGTVISTEWSNQSGNMIKILHGGGVETVYCHLSEFRVKQGDPVSQGQIIALSGDTGWDCRGAHLHFAVYGEPNPFARELVSYANAR
jgi:murein DD-endopeptidase MepM/ murein hydrolase activator NlpD